MPVITRSLSRALNAASRCHALGSRAFHASRCTWTLQRNVFEELQQRGFIADTTSPSMSSHLASAPRTLYSGVDPTAPSMHVGHLLPLLALLHFYLHGHTVISLIGGATGMIGDPSGRSTERTALSPEVLARNVESLTAQVERFFAKGKEHAGEAAGGEVRVMNNLEWLGKLSLIDFLSGPGKDARVGPMLARDSVKSRLSTHGLSFTEFTYQLLQAFDFAHLHAAHACTLQLGGSDQWGNIVAGIEMIRKGRPVSVEDEDEKAFGVTLPLLTTSSGEKFGKSAGNAVWLDEGLTSVYEFYQFFLRTQDADVERYLKLFTFLPLSRIAEAVAEHAAAPETRSAQRLLASEVTSLVHGSSGLTRALTATSVLFSNAPLSSLRAADVLAAFASDSRLATPPPDSVLGEKLVKLVGTLSQGSSISQARKVQQSGGLYLNNVRVDDVNRTLTRGDLIDGRLAFLRTGKAGHLIICIA